MIRDFILKHDTSVFLAVAFAGPIIFILFFVFFAMALPNEQALELSSWAGNFNEHFPSWLSAATAVFASFVGSLIVLQLRFSAKQLKRERESKEYEYFKRLAELDMMRVRRYTFCKEFISFQNQLKKSVVNGIPVNDALNEMRKNISNHTKSQKIYIAPNEFLELDHIEYTINYYNFMCKMLIDKSISEEFGTRLGTANFLGFYDKVDDYIYARSYHQKVKTYASHFKEYVISKNS